MSENVIIPNPEQFEKLKKAFLEGKAEKIHVLADFDRTLTTAFVDGVKRPSLISLLRDGEYLSPEYREAAHALFDKYHPIEIDPTLPILEKKAAMQEWWTKHFDLLIKSGLNKKDLKKVVASSGVKFRPGTLEMIDYLHEKEIPLVIISSSGIGDGVLMYLENEGRLYDNVHVITNLYEWDENGKAVGVKKPIIHCMNKDETVIKDFPVFNTVRHRTNVLLLGDSLGDLGMITGFDYDNLLKIGFLNEKVDENIQQYKENFNVVITNDSDMSYVNKILKEVVK